VARLLAAVLLLGAPAAALAGQGLHIVTSIPPYAMLTRAVAGPAAQVSSLVRPGQDPHRFDPSVGQIAALNRADLVVHNGAGEQWLGSHLEAVARKRRLSVAEEVPFEAIHGERGALNGHIWLDPDVASRLVAALAARLSALRPEEGDGFARRAAETLAAIQAADREVAQRLADLTPKRVVTFHPSFDYFFRHYGWQVQGTLRDLAGNEAGGARLAELLDTIRSQGLPAIFRERTTPPAPIRALARDAQVAVGVLDPLGLHPEVSDYPALLRHNAHAIAEAYAP
jgi:ABC-type Zn uptake system ZnuABC Zn-binding protein ZnuA